MFYSHPNNFELSTYGVQKSIPQAENNSIRKDYLIKREDSSLVILDSSCHWTKGKKRELQEAGLLLHKYQKKKKKPASGT